MTPKPPRPPGLPGQPAPSAPTAPAVKPASAGTPTTGTATVPAKSRTKETSADSAAAATDLVLAVTSIELARRIMSDARCWAIRPSSGKGEVRVRVVVDPKMPTAPDYTWLQAQLVLGMDIDPNDITPTSIIWSDPE